MGIQQSKGEFLYQQVSYGNSEVIRVLHRDGEDLEWMDREGKTPLILACMNAELYDVAKTLIELGSNVNAYRPARNAGTPLHHAAKRGLENTVKLLLSHGANPLVLDDDCQTPLEVARVKGFSNVVRAIESHICLFSGWMREFYGPTFLNLFAPQLLSRRVWVVIVPTGSRNPTKPFKLQLVVYASLQDAQPRTVMPLWKANLEEPKAKLSDTSMMIVDNSTKTRLKLAPATEGDRQQLKWFCDACKGIPQRMHPPVFIQTALSAPPPPLEDALAMAVNASVHATMSDTTYLNHYSVGQASSSAGPSSSTAPPPPSGKANTSIVTVLSSLFYILKFPWNINMQPMHPPVFLQTAPSAPPPPLEDALAMAVNASVHTTMSDTTNLNHYSVDQASSSAGPSSSTAPPPPSGKANTSIVMVLSSLFYILKFPWNINMQPMHPRVFLQTAPSAPAPPLEDALTMEVNASVHTTMSDTTNLNHYSVGQASSSAGPSSSTAPPPPSGIANASIVQGPSPSAPPLTDDDIAAAEDGPIHYPLIESTPVDVPSPSFLPASADGEKNEDRSSGTCAICLDAPSEAVCVPCGHIAGCMSCLNEIKSKKWGCPVCRAKIDQVIKVYRV